MRFGVNIAVWMAATIAAPASIAQDWKQQLDGLDGVSVACSNANKEDYATRICEEMSDFAVGEFEEAAIAVVDLGAWDAHDGQEPARPDTMQRPLKVTVFVRGTNSGGIHAINLRSRLSVDYDKAVEAGSTDTGRKGELVLWEGSTTGSGPQTELTDAIIQAGWNKLAGQLRAVVSAWPEGR